MSGRFPARCAWPSRVCSVACHSSGQRATRRSVLGARRDGVLDARSMPIIATLRTRWALLPVLLVRAGLCVHRLDAQDAPFHFALQTPKARRVLRYVGVQSSTWAFLTRRTRPVSHPAAVIRAAISSRSIRRILTGRALRRCKERLVGHECCSAGSGPSVRAMHEPSQLGCQAVRQR
jgi:hypothetical protein